MNKLRLIITGTVVLTLAVIIVAYAFWPDETAPKTESRDMKQIHKEDKAHLKAQQIVQQQAQQIVQQQPEEKEAVEPAVLKQPELVVQEESIRNAEKLYQIAMLSKESNDSPEISYTIVLDCCRLILEQYPNTAQAEKAKELLRQYDMTDRQISRLYSSVPAVKKSRSLRRRSRRRDDEWFIANSNEVNLSN